MENEENIETKDTIPIEENTNDNTENEVKFYLRIDKEKNSFGFVSEDIHDVKDADIPITEEEYNKFFELQSKGKQFKLKDKPTGKGLFDYIEEYTLTPVQNDSKSELNEYKEVVLSLQELVLTQQMTILNLQYNN